MKKPTIRPRDSGPGGVGRSLTSTRVSWRRFSPTHASPQPIVGERFEFRSRLDGLVQAIRLAWVTDAFLAQALYRMKARSQALRLPLLPMVAHHLAMVTGQVCIGDPVVMRPGVYLPHGQVVIDGLVEIERGTTIAPFVTIGLIAGNIQVLRSDRG